MAGTSVLRPLLPAPAWDTGSATADPASSADIQETPARDAEHTSSGRISSILGPSAGLILTSLAIVAVLVRQLTTNATVPAPLTNAEAGIGVNAYARLHLPDLHVPTSLSNDFASWQLSGYSYLSSAHDRHDSLTGPTRELVILASVLTAALIVGVCRRLHFGWFSTAVAVSLSGVPAAAALLRIASAPAAMAAFWIAIAALAAAAAVTPRNNPGPASARRRASTVPLLLLASAAAVIAVMTAEVAAVLLLGLVFAHVVTRRSFRQWPPGRREVVVIAALLLLLAAFWVSVFGPATAGDDVAGIHVIGVVVAPGGLIVAAAGSLIDRLRTIAFGAVPILVAAAWPGPEQATALVLGLVVVSVLSAGLLDEFLFQQRPSRGLRLGAVSLVAAVFLTVFVLPLPQPAASTVTSSPEVATWIETQLMPDDVIAVDPLMRAQLVRNGLDPRRLSASVQTRRAADFVLAPLFNGSDLPLIAKFGSASAELGLRLVVPDPAAYTAAQIHDEAARSEFGADLAENPSLALSGRASSALAAGDVDARLMVDLAGAASTARFTIARFTGTVGDLDSGNIFRQVTLTDITDLDPAGNAAQSPVRRLIEFFETQQSPYRPVTVLEVADTITVRFAAPSPLGLLP